MSNPQSSSRLLAAQIVGLTVLLGLLAVDSTQLTVGLDREEGINLVVAKSLAAGDGVRMAQHPDRPVASGVQPAFPAVLALFGRMWPAFPANLTLMRIFQAFALGLSAAMMVWIAGRLKLPVSFTVGAVLLGFLAAPVVSMQTMAVAQPMFLLLVSTAVLVVGDGQSPRFAVMAGVVAGSAAAVVDLGFLPALAIVAALLSQREHRKAGLVAVGAAAVVAVVWLAGGLGAGSVETTLGMDGLPGAWRELTTLFTRFADVPVLPVGLSGLLVVAAGVGIVRCWQHDRRMVLVTGAILAGVALGPAVSHRTALVLLPWLAVFAAVGIRWTWALNNRTRIPVAAVGALLAAGLAVPSLGQLAARGGGGAGEHETASMRLLLSSVSQETPAEAIVASDVDMVVHLFTGRATVPLLGASGGDGSIDALCAAGATHLGLRDQERHADLVAADASLPVYRFTNGSALFELQCRP